MRATESVSFCMSTIPQDGRANIFQHNPTDRCWHYVKVPCPKDEYNPSLLVKYGKGKFIGGPECFDFYDPGPCDKERNFDKLNEAKVDPAYAKEFKGLRGPTAPEPLGDYNDIFRKKQLEIAKIYRSAIDKYKKFYDEFVGSDQARQTQHYNDWKKVYQDVNWGGVLPNQGRRVGKRTPGRAPVKSEAQENQVEAQEEESEEEEQPQPQPQPRAQPRRQTPQVGPHGPRGRAVVRRGTGRRYTINGVQSRDVGGYGLRVRPQK